MNTKDFTRVDETCWRLEPQGGMNVPVVIYADERIIAEMDEKVREQATNVSRLPGIDFPAARR